MKSLKNILLILTLTLTFSYGVDESKITPVMKQKINEVTSILKEDDLEKKKKQKQLFNIMDDVFDFELMAKISLGRSYSGLSKDKQDEYTKNFIQRLKNSYLDKMDLYTDEEIKIVKEDKIKHNRIYLYTNIIGKKDVYEVIYKFYDNKGDWLIYDVDILGVSIIQTYRKQFSEYLATKSIDELIKNLK